jgi:AcrR family transcriptional regulator
MGKKGFDTRSTILKVALQLFFTDGYKDVSYQDLIEKTGLSKGAIYHHFKSKEDILVSVFEFFLQTSKQPNVVKPEDKVKSYESFRKLFIDTKKEQFESFKKILDTKSLKVNKLLFFLEAINENEKLKKTIGDLMKHETLFLEKCFLGLKKNNKLPKGKSPSLLAKGLYWMLQGAEMIFIFEHNDIQESDFINVYNKILSDFFKII